MHQRVGLEEEDLIVWCLMLPPPPTLFAHTDVQQPRAEAVPQRDTEAGIGCGVGKHLAGGAEAIRGDLLHHHILLIDGVQGPSRKRRALTRRNSADPAPAG